MCGRYSLYDDEDHFEIYGFLNELAKRYPESEINVGEIFPTNAAPALVQAKDDQLIKPELFTWGFPAFKSSGVIINARSETVTSKFMFSEAMQKRRCIIPSTGFYEWTHEGKKKKYHFTLPNEKALYMAGLYSIYDGKPKFVILTTDANNYIADVHNRMPLIIKKENIDEWINDKNSAIKLLTEATPALEREMVG